MDRMYLKNVLDSLNREKAVHNEKFAGNEAHLNCLPNFDRAIEKLEQELLKLGAESLAKQQGSAN